MNVLIGPNSYQLERVVEELASSYPEISFTHCSQSQDLSQNLAKTEVYLGWLGRDQFLAAENIKWIQSPSTGVDRFLAIPELRKGDVLLTSARGTHGPVLAEHTFALIFSITRGMHHFAFDQRERQWTTRSRRSTLSELRGTTLGLVGFGSIGRAIALRAQSFGIKLVAVDVQDAQCPEHISWVGDLGRLNELMAVSDVVVITVPYTAETYHMINKARIEKMQSHAILVGISRGGIIDENDLVHALKAGTIRAAALDVCEKEPLPEESPLWDVNNLILTPHVGGGSQYEAEGILQIFKENIGRYTKGEFPLLNQVDKTRGF